MFCSCRADYQRSPPNSLVCAVCLGMPGMLPVINRRAVEYVIMTGLALDCAIAGQTKFDRKNYPYPDLMKGYQISQYDQPIAENGYLDIRVDGVERRIGITRVHLEEDVAKLFHRTDTSGEGYSLLDVNRSGVALMETVGEPDLRSAEEAREYLIQLQSILQYLGVSTANMEEGSFRCDANVSLRPRGSSELGTKVEVKNMNSFRAVYRALEYEVERQGAILADGGRVAQETRGWQEEQEVTVSQRSKEYANDYRYFPEPDLPPLTISGRWVEEIRARLPELPEARRERLVREYGLPDYDASLLTASRATADFFEAATGLSKATGDGRTRRAKAVANWMTGEVARLLNASGRELSESLLQPRHVSDVVGLVEEGTLTTSMAKELFEEVFKTGRSPGDVVKERGMSQITDTSALEQVVREALDANGAAVADYLSGKETAIRFLTGQVMKATRGQANPQLVNQLLVEKLKERSDS